MALTKDGLISEKDLERMVETLKAIAHPVRLKIVNLLMKSECSVGYLVSILGTKQSLTSQQLSILKTRGVLKARRKGNIVFYSLVNKGVRNIMESIHKEIS